MSAKIKSKQKLLIEERQTVDAKHNNILKTFDEYKAYLPKLNEELNMLTTQINALTKENNESPIFNKELQMKIWALDDKKIALEKDIKNIMDNTEENIYMLNTGKILSNYYKILEQEKQYTAGIISSDTNNIVDNSVVDNNVDNKSSESDDNQGYIKRKCIIDWFSQSPKNTMVFENVDTGKKICNVKRKKKMPLQQVETKIEPVVLESKDVVYEKYMKAIDKNYINIDNDIDIFDTCKTCMVEMLINNNTGLLICPKCGITENIIVDSDKPSFKEPPKEMTSFCYKRINHLNEFLAQFQAKETTDIPEDVYNEILLEIKKERITNMALITPDKMRLLLKRIKKNDYYEHIPYIINQLNGLPAPVIAPEIEEIIRGMFKAIQIPFEKYCPYKRKNFLSYNYVMYKFFELLDLDEYLQCFQLLKSRTKLHQQDQIWKNICQDLNWQFIRSL